MSLDTSHGRSFVFSATIAFCLIPIFFLVEAIWICMSLMAADH